MPSNQAARVQRLERREQVWKLRLEGKTERDIANEIGTVTNVTIHNDLKALIRNATAHLDEEVKRERIVQLHQLHLVVKEAFDAWTESKKLGQQVIETEGSPSKRNPDGTKTTTKIGTKQTGNPAYLTLAMKAMEDIRKLFGLDAFKDDWESELKAAGLNPAEIFETMVQSAYQAMTTENG
jgi:hypothetical protein